MFKPVNVVLGVLVFSFALAQAAEAQLINYNRKNKMLRQATTGTPVQEQDDKDMPGWMKEMPRAKDKLEKEYDVNRDGYLQTAEVKILLRDVIQEVNDRGGVEVTSDILKEYDKNRDGLINKFELDKIKSDSR